MMQAKAVSLAAVRILAGYLAACAAASVLVFALSVVMSMDDPPIAGRSALGELANMAGWMPFYFVAAAVFAAPVALVGIAISELAKIKQLWFFLALGATAPLPLLLRGADSGLENALEGLVIFAPAGALAAAVFWLVRHRKWPV